MEPVLIKYADGLEKRFWFIRSYPVITVTKQNKPDWHERHVPAWLKDYLNYAHRMAKSHAGAYEIYWHNPYKPVASG